MKNAFTEDGQGNASLVIGAAGKGTSRLTDLMRLQVRAQGHLLVDTQLFRDGTGLKPFEQEYARRIVQHIDGRPPKAVRGKVACFISDVQRPQKRKKQAVHLVTTANGVVLDRALVKEAGEQLASISGIVLNQPQLIELMEELGIDETLAEYGEAETQIREMLADALSLKLIDRSWPTCGALFNKAFKADTGFAKQLDHAAAAAGYKLL